MVSGPIEFQAPIAHKNAKAAFETLHEGVQWQVGTPLIRVVLLSACGVSWLHSPRDK